jgi:NAD(P)-dependent dehydrogenase (short-subunit alcohol dehydrogenase family)
VNGERTAFVTGATGGLGPAVAARLRADGWRVVAPSRREADLFDPQAVSRAIEDAAGDAASPLGAVVNLVGGFAAGPRVAEAPIEDFEAQLRLNLRPTYLVTQAALPHLVAAGGGAIVCVGSRAAVRPFAGAAGYAAAKAAVVAFAQAVAVEYADEGVRCNAILPSVIDTPANRAAMPDADPARWVAPEQLAGVIAHLCSEDAFAISGAAIPVYGRA